MQFFHLEFAVKINIFILKYGNYGCIIDFIDEAVVQCYVPIVKILL